MDGTVSELRKSPITHNSLRVCQDSDTFTKDRVVRKQDRKMGRKRFLQAADHSVVDSLPCTDRAWRPHKPKITPPITSCIPKFGNSMSKNNSQGPSIFSPSRFSPTSEEVDSQLAENQLKAELAQAAELPMVSTRSRDHDLENADSSAQVKSDTSVIGSKRRIFEKSESDPPKQSATKRQKKKAETQAVNVIRQSPPPEQKVERSSSAGEAQGEVKETEDKSTFKVHKEGERALAKHQRFGSENAEVDTILESSRPSTTNEEEQSQDDDDSDDDAPEAITAAAGFEASRAAAVDAARIAETWVNFWPLHSRRQD